MDVVFNQAAAAGVQAQNRFTMKSERFSAAKIFLSFFLSGLLLGACQKKADANEPEIIEACPEGNTATTTGVGYQKILGAWDWVQDELSQRGVGTSYQTPASTGKNLRLEFRDNRSYQFIENQAVIESGTFALRQAGTDPLLVLDLTPTGKDPNGGVLITLCDEGLVLLGGANDAGSNRSFQRVQGSR